MLLNKLLNLGDAYISALGYELLNFGDALLNFGDALLNFRHAIFNLNLRYTLLNLRYVLLNKLLNLGDADDAVNLGDASAFNIPSTFGRSLHDIL